MWTVACCSNLNVKGPSGQTAMLQRQRPAHPCTSLKMEHPHIVPLQDKSMGSNVLSWSQYSGRLWVMLLRASRQGLLFIDYFCHIRISGVAQFPSLIGQAGLFLCNTSAHWWREHLGSPELRAAMADPTFTHLVLAS